MRALTFLAGTPGGKRATRAGDRNPGLVCCRGHGSTHEATAKAPEPQPIGEKCGDGLLEGKGQDVRPDGRVMFIPLIY
jgi:hypothetical protein